MKFIIHKGSLYKALQSVQSVADKKNTMPILSNVMLECSGNELNLSATDLEVSIRRTLPVQAERDGNTTIPARKFFEIVKELPADSISVSSGENQEIVIQCAGILFKLKGLPTDEFPSLPEYGDEELVELAPQTLMEMIDKTFYSISTEDIQYNLSGILVHRLEERPESLRFVATDGHRLALIDRDFSIPFLSEEGIIVPRKGIMEIRKILQDVDGPVGLTLDKNQLIIRSADITLFVRLIEGIFPNYKDVIPESNPKILRLERAGFYESLKRASIVSAEKFRGIRLDLAPKRLTISSNNPDVGESQEVIDVEYEDEAVSMAFNARYFMDVLSSVDSESVLFEVDDASSPAILKDDADDRFLAVVMPMRI
jgi:DNA polymerase-3 subunit beta